MRIKMLVLTLGLVFSFAGQSAVGCEDSIVGRFTNPAYDGKFSVASVEISEVEDASYEMVFDIPCDTKVTPRRVVLHPSSCTTGRLEVIEEGSSQCFLGENAGYDVIGNFLEIYVANGVRVPGFNGVYRLHRQP